MGQSRGFRPAQGLGRASYLERRDSGARDGLQPVGASPTWMLLSFVWAAPCADPGALANASRSYQERGDYASLKILAEHLRQGMPRHEVEALLGPPGLEPAGGHSVYGSDRKEQPSWADRELFVAL